MSESPPQPTAEIPTAEEPKRVPRTITPEERARVEEIQASSQEALAIRAEEQRAMARTAANAWTAKNEPAKAYARDMYQKMQNQELTPSYELWKKMRKQYEDLAPNQDEKVRLAFVMEGCIPHIPEQSRAKESQHLLMHISAHFPDHANKVAKRIAGYAAQTGNSIVAAEMACYASTYGGARGDAGLANACRPIIDKVRDTAALTGEAKRHVDIVWGNHYYEKKEPEKPLPAAAAKKKGLFGKSK